MSLCTLPSETLASPFLYPAVTVIKLHCRCDDFVSGVCVSLRLNFPLYSHTKHFGEAAMGPDTRRC